MPLLRSSFPIQWMQSTQGQEVWVNQTTQAQQSLLPLGFSQGGSTYPPSVISGITTTMSNANMPQQQQQQQQQMPPQVQIRQTNIHPIIKTAMSAYVQKFRSIRLTQLLASLGLTLADLPTLPSMALSETSLCYNFVLGKCVHNGCQHKHAAATEISDEFATKLVNILSPAVQNFMTNGAPRQKRKRRTT